MQTYRSLSPKERVDIRTAMKPSGPNESISRWEWCRETYFQNDSRAYELWLGTWAANEESPWRYSEIESELPDAEVASLDWAQWLTLLRAWKRPAVRPSVRPIAAAIRPFVEYTIWCLHNDLAALALGSRETKVILKGARKWLNNRLSNIAGPSVSVALRAALLTDELQGHSGAEKVRDFAARMSVWNQREALLRRSPILDRLLAQVCLDTRAAIFEFCKHICADRRVLSELSGGKLAVIAAVEFGLGDPHRNSRTVNSVRLESGSRLIYKPRSLSSDRAFNAILSWVGEHLEDAPRPLQTVSFSDHGWCEFANAAECASLDEVRRAFRRMGMLLATYDLCAGTDLHYENIVFDGPNPYIVDLETILMPIVNQDDHAKLVSSIANHDAFQRTGYLPGGMVIKGFRRDVSAGGLHRRVESPFSTVYFDDRDGEALQYKLKKYWLTPSDNCPRYKGRRVAASRYLDELCKGVADAYTFFWLNKETILSRGWLGNALQEVEVRWVARGTAVYSQMLQKSFHPIYMRDGLDHELAYAPLTRSGPGQAGRADILRAEADDLWRCDIPLFTTPSSSRSAYDSQGREIESVFAESGWEAFNRRVLALSQTSANRAVSSIEAAFSALSERPKGHPAKEADKRSHLNRSALLAEADHIGRTLLERAHEAQAVPFWVGPRHVSIDAISAQICGYDLYRGVAGIGVFFAELGRITQEARYLEAARRCREGIRLALGQSDLPLGAFNGAAGLLYGEVRISDCLGDRKASPVSDALNRIEHLGPSDAVLDIIGGTAGALAVVAEIGRRQPFQADARRVATLLANRLRATAEKSNGIAAWRTPMGPPMKGFAHGSAGVAFALARAADFLGVREYDDLIIAALRHVESDADDHHDEKHSGRAWCHGRAGTSLAFLHIDRLRPGILAEVGIDTAPGLEQTRDSLAGGNHSLCHGVLGNIEPMLMSGEQQVVNGAVAFALSEKSTNGGWICGLGQECPSLMVGLAGIGHQLLRCADESVPDVLTLSLQLNTKSF